MSNTISPFAGFASLVMPSVPMLAVLAAISANFVG